MYYRFINGNYCYECNVGMWGNPQHIEDSYVFENFKMDEFGGIDGDMILEHDKDNTKLIFWSEERELRKRNIGE